MKIYKFILLIFISALFCNGSCGEKRIDKCSITIQNNSDKEIVRIGMVYTTASVYTSIAQDTTCLKPPTTFEYENFIYYNTIKPYSSKKDGVDWLVEDMHTYSDGVLWFSVGIFNRTDMDTMSCEEFKQKYPLKKEWKITLADLEACDFNMVLEYTE